MTTQKTRARTRKAAKTPEMLMMERINGQLTTIEGKIDDIHARSVKSGAIAGALAGGLTGGLVATSIMFVKTLIISMTNGG